MGLAQLFGRTETRAIRDPAWNLWGQGADIGYGASSDAGMRVTQENSRQLLTVFGCQSLISDYVSMMPRDVYRKSGEQRVPVTGPFWLTDKTNVETTPDEFILQSVISLLSDGNYFWTPFRNDRAQVLEVWCLDPCRVDVRRENRQLRYYVDGVLYQGEMVHGRWFVPPGAVRGINPIEVARQAIGLGMAAQSFGAKFFANGSVPDVVITVPGDPTDEQMKALARSFQASHSGRNSHLPAVVTNGGGISTLTIAPEHAQFLETRSFSAAEIAAQLYRVDPTWLGINQSGSSLTYSNTEQRGIDLVRWTLMPWMKRIERGITALLPRPQYMKLNADEFMRADLKGRYDAYAVGITSKFLLPDEARATEDLPPLPDGAGAKFAEPPAPVVPVQQTLPGVAP